MSKKYIIYLHRNKINNKCYVGQTSQALSQRWGSQGQGYKRQEYFYNAILKYGWENFEHIILEENVEEEIVDDRECYWGEYYQSLAPNGYNLYLGNQSKRVKSEEQFKKYSEIFKEKWKDDEYRNRVVEGRKRMWKEASEECKQKMLNNLDKTGKGAKAKMKRVLCIELNKIYESTREAERQTGVGHANISQVCNGKRKTAGGYHWKFV